MYLQALSPPPHEPLLACLRTTFAARADAGRAAAMQAYMKSAMPFMGLAAPSRRALTVAAVRQHPVHDTATLASTILALWRQARYREERYAAAELARTGTHRRFVTMALLPVFEELIVSGAWWDYDDELSGNAIALLLAREPAAMRAVLLRWANCDDLWLRRAAILCQRKRKAGFDAALLYQTILPSIGSAPLAREFFLRKGIGWALRERSYAAPDEVQAFCSEYAAQLSPLTVREALKALQRTKARAAGQLRPARPQSRPRAG